MKIALEGGPLNGTTLDVEKLEGNTLLFPYVINKETRWHAEDEPIDWIQFGKLEYKLVWIQPTVYAVLKYVENPQCSLGVNSCIRLLA